MTTIDTLTRFIFSRSCIFGEFTKVTPLPTSPYSSETLLIQKTKTTAFSVCELYTWNIKDFPELQNRCVYTSLDFGL